MTKYRCVYAISTAYSGWISVSIGSYIHLFATAFNYPIRPNGDRVDTCLPTKFEVILVCDDDCKTRIAYCAETDSMITEEAVLHYYFDTNQSVTSLLKKEPL